ncbi:MAG: N-6 DNA methylase, partial [Bryobacterales bacterium]|nr:N-6 DNA methylase [Bryobacterales bacterium]
MAGELNNNMAYDPIARDHLEWLGYVQPVGLVVSLPALLDAGAAINRNYVPLHRSFLEVLPQDRDGEPVPELPHFPAFAEQVLGWDLSLLEGASTANPVDEALCAPLPDYGETLRPKYALRDVDESRSCLLLAQEVSGDFDTESGDVGRKWQATPQARLERLLRETGVPIGLLVSREAIRLVYAPRGETSGHITFRMEDMVRVAGRPILAALWMLLGSERLYSLGESQRLPKLLENSRRFQNVVSTQLAGQVLEALYELLRGFQAADDARNGELLRATLTQDPNRVYSGLLTVLMRLVFLLYAEDRELLGADPVYTKHYSVGGLYERLREDNARYPDTMDSRFGAWAHLLALFRLVWKGAQHQSDRSALRIPARKGYLFDPDRYPFLSGAGGEIPQVPDGVLFRVLSKLLVLNGERLSYRALDVEQIGSVYEAIMGFELQVAAGPSIAIKAKKRHGAPVSINLQSLLATAADKRGEWLLKQADQKLTGQAADALKRAATVDDLLAALDRRIARHITPHPVPKGAMIFQPSPERRRSGSHYTPRSLTGPIVQAALAPVLGRLGRKPKPEQILGLKVCDPAMGSGAFLVETCRQLGDALVESWQVHNATPTLPPDEDIVLHARRQVAQRCLYGVDRNPMAADLAKLSLWLATLAKDHPFTFLDHSLRHGDALVGLTAQGVGAVHWEDGMPLLFREDIVKRIENATYVRQQILAAPDDVPYELRENRLAGADSEIELARMAGDLAVLAFFEGDSAKKRKLKREELVGKFGRRDPLTDVELDQERKQARQAKKAIAPFHWEIEFPEVFALDKDGRRHAGFDAMVGNPPFAGKNTLIEGNADGYVDWLKQVHPESHGNADLVAHFYRRAFSLLRQGGCFGLIATNTIGQGDTRSTGLRWICTHGGTIYRARKRLPWPGEAAVVVSVVHVCNGEIAGPYWLDRRQVDRITAYLFHAGGHEDPAKLKANEGKSFQGSIVLGMGFTFDDTDTKGVASPISEMHRLIEKDPRNAERIFPYLGGEE